MHKMKRDEFITILMRQNPQELNQFLLEKGKDGKAVCPVVFHNTNLEDHTGGINHGKM
jgi:hypothetical protein